MIAQIASRTLSSYNDRMAEGDTGHTLREAESARFATTHWSIALQAGRRSSPDSDQALESLCRAYWYPLYAYVRRRGRSAEDAKDLMQEFFARLIQKEFLKAADPERGRFRAFLLMVFKRFLATEHERQQAQKRGGGMKRDGARF